MEPGREDRDHTWLRDNVIRPVWSQWSPVEKTGITIPSRHVLDIYLRVAMEPGREDRDHSTSPVGALPVWQSQWSPVEKTGITQDVISGFLDDESSQWSPVEKTGIT